MATEKITCECTTQPKKKSEALSLPRKLTLIAGGLFFWWLLYRQLGPSSAWFTYNLLGLDRGSHLGEAVAFFVYDKASLTDSLAMVDESRSAKVYANFQDKITASVPDNVPNWIMGRYEELTQVCVAAEDAPATEGTTEGTGEATGG